MALPSTMLVNGLTPIVIGARLGFSRGSKMCTPTLAAVLFEECLLLSHPINKSVGCGLVMRV
jgi:hypothetical protein